MRNGGGQAPSVDNALNNVLAGAYGTLSVVDNDALSQSNYQKNSSGLNKDNGQTPMANHSSTVGLGASGIGYSSCISDHYAASTLVKKS